MPTSVATVTDLSKITARATALEERAVKAEARLAALEQTLTVLTGGTATNQVGD